MIDVDIESGGDAMRSSCESISDLLSRTEMSTVVEHVIKRDGRREEVRFDKVYKRILKMAFGLECINVHAVSKAVISGIYNGVTTEELDMLTVKVAASMTVEHPDYGLLAGRISISALKKKAPSTFSEAIDRLYNNKHPQDPTMHVPIVSQELWAVVMADREKWDALVVNDRDFNYNIFAVETLRKSYLLSTSDGVIVETPQYMHLRVALGLNLDDHEGACRTYHATSTFQYTHASPTLFNAGTTNQQLASCFLVRNKDDSIDGIYETLKECAMISKVAGGIGLSVHDVRSKGSYIKGNNGQADGLIPMLRVYNETAKYVNQGGKRKGAIAIYLEPWHADIYDFLDIRKGHGAEERRARDLFTALWLSDLFMRRCEADGDWTLFDPAVAPGLNLVFGEEFERLYEQYEAEGRGVKVVKAQHLWGSICTSIIETGGPYLANKDQANLMNNQANLGTIQSSNLCVAPETPILTSKGYLPIASLVDQEVDVWNGEEWSSTTVRQTGADQKLIRVILSNGSELECTPYHRFFIETSGSPSNKSIPVIVEAKDLVIGQKLIKHELPVVDIEGSPDFPYAYTHGFFCGDGTYQKDECGNYHMPRISLYGEKKGLITQFDIRTSSFRETSAGIINIHLPHDIPTKFSVPHGSYSVKSRLEWFAGLCDSDGTVMTVTTASGKVSESIQIASIHKEFLVNTMLMLQTLGVHSKVTHNRDAGQQLLPDGRGGQKFYKTKPVSRLLIAAFQVQKLLELGLNCRRLKLERRVYRTSSLRFVTVQGILDEGRVDDTFCFTEPRRNMGMFNGVITSQCCEINQFTSPTETAVCVLASVNLSAFVGDDGSYSFDALADTASLAVKNLNKVIDLMSYPTETARRSMSRHRPLGLGVSGLADVFFKLGIAFDSPEAHQLNRDMCEALYYGAVRQSIEEARIHGPYSTYAGSPASLGLLQFDMWRSDEMNRGVRDPELFERLRNGSTLNWGGRWADLKASMAAYGLRNSLLTAYMPTSSSATLIGVNECFEPITSNIYRRSVLSGEFILVNKYLVQDLIKLDMWTAEVRDSIIANDGSVQHLDIPENIKEIYKTVWELSMKTVIDQSFDRAQYVDQSQSLNLFLKNPNTRKVTSMLFYGWHRGLKTMLYYLRTRAANEAVKFTCTSCVA